MKSSWIWGGCTLHPFTDIFTHRKDAAKKPPKDGQVKAKAL